MTRVGFVAALAVLTWFVVESLMHGATPWVHAQTTPSGWYYLMPPNKSPRPSVREWTQLRAFDSATECEAYRDDQKRQAAKLAGLDAETLRRTDDGREPTPIQKKAVILFGLTMDAVCIQSSDSRLK
jgi:hypothetical protein